jgi:hypothetical protein
VEHVRDDVLRAVARDLVQLKIMSIKDLVGTNAVTYVFHPGDKGCHLQPAAPVHRVFMNAPDEKPQCSLIVFLLGKDHAIPTFGC